MNEQQETSILIRCHALPESGFGERSAVRLGIQKGQEVIDDRLVTGRELTFQAVLRVSGQTTGKPNFLGPFAQGKPMERFLYLCWGERREGRWELFGRAKIPLSAITWNCLERASRVGEPITLSVAMTDSRGRAACGTIRSE